MQPLELFDKEALDAALTPYRHAGKVEVWQENSMLMALADAPLPHQDSLFCRCPETGLVVAFWGRLDNRNELHRALGLPGESSDPCLILAAYLRWKGKCPEYLVGDFSFAIADPCNQEIFLARDPMGVKPLYYLAEDRFFAFGTTAAILTKLKIGRPEPDMDWAAAYLANLSHSYTGTAYRNVLKLGPGHCLTMRQGKMQLRKYFQFRDDAPVASRRDGSWVEAYREALEESVRCRLNPRYPMGFENSAGLDSSAIMGLAARYTEQPLSNLHGFSFIFFDLEPEYIFECSRFFGIVNNHAVSRFLDFEDNLLERSVAVNGYPLENLGLLPIRALFYRWCQMFGIRSLFSGFGGDQCVTYEGHLLRPELLAERQYLTLWNNIPGNPAIRALRYAKAVKKHLYPQSFSPSWQAANSSRWHRWILRQELAQKLYESHMEKARFDAPYRRINDFILQNQLSPELTTVLENNTLMTQSYGVELCTPLLDVRLIQQYLSTPSIEKSGPQHGRFLHRRAIEGLVPPKVQWKPKHMGDLSFKPDWQDESLKKLAQFGLRELADLHPALEYLIDRQKLSEQINRSLKGSVEYEFFAQFILNINKLRGINHWLKGLER